MIFADILGLGMALMLEFSCWPQMLEQTLLLCGRPIQ